MRLSSLLLLTLCACSGRDPQATDVAVETDPFETDDTDTVVDTDPPLPVDEDGDGYAVDVDCDDLDPETYPGALEADCTDPVDRNCDGEVPLFADDDADGVAACADCDDTEPTVFAGAVEICDGLDNDCDGLLDDEDEVDPEELSTWYLDRDYDGYGDTAESVRRCEAPFGYVSRGGDCDDGASWISPFALERCDGFDNDCDDKVDIDDDDIVDQVAWFADRDGDGWGDPRSSTLACEPPRDHVGNDLDCDDRDARSDTATLLFRDTDEDGYGDPTTREPRCDTPEGYTADASDCDDGDASIHPGASELCDGVDNDCDTRVDDDDADVQGLSSWYPDVDGDGYGADNVSAVEACEAPKNTVGDRTDCEDRDVGIHPGRFDWGDRRDNDCDGTVDEDAGSETTSHDSDIQPIWNTNCTRCHGSSGGLSLRTDGHAALVNAPTSFSVDYIEPGYPSRSYLWLKVNNLHRSVRGTGRSMPTTGPITQSELDTIETWILEGAIR